MKTRANKSSPKIDAALGRSINFESSIADLARRSERRAWFVASTAVLVSLILLGGYFYLLPLKEKVPYLVMADAYTGTSTVARLTGSFGDNDITVSEAINRSNVAHFVLARESWDAELINLRDWTTVYTMASNGVAATYSHLHDASNPDNPRQLYGKDQAVRVRILSIVLLGGSAHSRPRGATVRFQRSLFDKSSGTEKPLDSKIATLEFTYKSNLDMDEQDRIENPLGFQVSSYRVDNDYAAAPPLQAQVSGAPSIMQTAASTLPPDTAMPLQSSGSVAR